MELCYYGYWLYPNRSYAAFCWPATLESDIVAGNACQVEWRNFSDAIVSGGDVTPSDISQFEPFPKAGHVRTFTFTPSVNSPSVYWIRILNNTGATHTINVVVLETTLASPWYFVNPMSGYESYVEIRNQASGPVSVTVRVYNSVGALVGSTTVSVPGNGNTFQRVGADLGASTETGSVAITSDGMPGSIVANITTLSGMTGLSFGAPFTSRMVWSVF